MKEDIFNAAIFTAKKPYKSTIRFIPIPEELEIQLKRNKKKIRNKKFNRIYGEN